MLGPKASSQVEGQRAPALSVAMDFPLIMVSRSEKRSRGRADRIGSSRWMVVEDPAPAMAKQGLLGGALDDGGAEESERLDAIARGGSSRTF